MDRQPWGAGGPRSRKYKLLLLCVWAVVLVVCFLNRDRFTVDGVLSYSPQNALLAAAFMLLLFALKSLSVFLFCGILFAADGLLFPLPAAVALNLLGAGIMVSLPYWLGRRLGKDQLDRIVQKYPRVEALRELRTEHEFIVSFAARAISILPSDVLSLYMGAAGTGYGKYLAGSVLGMLLPIVTFPIMGMNLTDPRSPAFLASLCVQAAASAAAIAVCWACGRRKRKRQGP